MNEKKLTDEEILKALENTRITLDDLKEDDDDYEKLLLVKKITNCSLDLIRRLQYGYSSASKASEEWKAKYEKERKENAEYEQKLYDGELDIESYARSWEEGDNRTVTCDLLNAMEQAVAVFNKQKAEIERLTEENEHLDMVAKQALADYQNAQVQVDELKANQVIECHGMLKGCDMVKQAVKDTAKEIFTDVDNAFSLYYPHGQIPYSVFQDVITQLAKKKGVEVE